MLTLHNPSSLSAKSAGLNVFDRAKPSTTASTTGRIGSIKSRTSADRPSPWACMNPIVGSSLAAAISRVGGAVARWLGAGKSLARYRVGPLSPRGAEKLTSTPLS